MKQPDSPSVDDLKKFIEEIGKTDQRLSELSELYKRRYAASCERSEWGEEIIDFLTTEINLEWLEHLTGFKEAAPEVLVSKDFLDFIKSQYGDLTITEDMREWLKIVFENSSENKIYVYILPLEAHGIVVNHIILHIDYGGPEQETKGLPPYLFVMLGLYAGLRREEILALKWDSVYLDLDAPYLTVCRAWHTENNRPVILTELKTNAAKRSIPLPPRLLEALKEAKESSTSDYVIANKDGQPLTYTQFKRLWTYITTRTAKPRKAKKLVGGKYVKYTIYPVLGEKARNNGKVVYSLDFEVTPHQLRHTYITNLIFASVDPKTVQYLAGHENSKITMDIYAKAKYNRPKDVAPMLEHVFNQWNEATTK